MFCSFNCVNFNWHIYCNVNKQLPFFDLVFSIWGKSSAISAHVQKTNKQTKKTKEKTRKALTSFKCISEEVHLPLWAWNSENSFMVEACDTHKHIFTPYDAFIDAWYAQVHKKKYKTGPSTYSFSLSKALTAWLTDMTKTDSPWRFMKRMQLSTTTGICCPELCRKKTVRRREMRRECGAEDRNRVQREMQREGEEKKDERKEDQ